MYVFQPRPVKRKVELQLAAPKLPPMINDVTEPLPAAMRRNRRDFKGLTPKEIHAIGKSIYRSVSVKEDLEEAIFYFRVAAEMAYPPSMNMYAYCLDQSLNPGTSCYGYFTTLNLGSPDFKRREMIKYYRAAADAQHKRALNNLGVCYIQGNGVPPDPERGMELLLQSKELGDRLGSKNYDTFAANHSIPSRKLSFAYTGR
jgi:TPR repeat protein